MGAEAQRLAKSQMSRFEKDVATLKSRVKSIINNADFNKDQATEFHLQSVSMNRAATYWPILHVAVILVGGVWVSVGVRRQLSQSMIW